MFMEIKVSAFKILHFVFKIIGAKLDEERQMNSFIISWSNFKA